jgi:DNA-binding winged helix-turn-helix (wHTH) protein
MIGAETEMDVQAHDQGVLSFGPFRIDCARRHLACNGVRVKISPRLFDTLLYFATNAGRIVEKDELMQAVWGGRIVEDANLSQTIFALRKMLRDEGGLEEAILTAPGRGYRLVLPVHREAEVPPARRWWMRRRPRCMPSLPLMCRRCRTSRLPTPRQRTCLCGGLWLARWRWHWV